MVVNLTQATVTLYMNVNLPVFGVSSGTAVNGPVLRGDDLVDIRTGDTSTVCAASSDLLDFVALPYNIMQAATSTLTRHPVCPRSTHAFLSVF